MRIEVPRKLFSVDDYYRMAEVGILGPEDRVELIDGEIIWMSPIGDRHALCVNIANELFVLAFNRKAIVSVQNPIRLNNYSEPQPDIVLRKTHPERQNKHPRPEDTILVVEVSDTTFKYDSTFKLPRYAKAGVPEVWIEDLQRNRLLVYRNPSDNNYLNSLTLGRNDSVFVQAFPDSIFAVDKLLG